MYSRTIPFIDDIPSKILANLNKIGSVSSLLPMVKMWNQQLVPNIQPREEDLDLITYDDKHFLFFFMYRVKVNLPLTILNFMKKIIIASHEGMSFLIPFGRVPYELFVQEGIVKEVQDVEKEKRNEEERSLSFSTTTPTSPFVLQRLYNHLRSRPHHHHPPLTIDITLFLALLTSNNSVQPSSISDPSRDPYSSTTVTFTTQPLLTTFNRPTDNFTRKPSSPIPP
ncbi:hypothetical protein KIW84_064228 [Lathyrus oleraceus]|uniref:Uncharacterized protein n=1 Tax=Pisum sativum TaxID=3888 RepID=A0A9D5A8E2_PEA|nr:hypothetical protein KIW84_064228 [Pisum sativum]